MRTWLTGFFIGFVFAMTSAALANDPNPEGALQSSTPAESVPSLPDDQAVESRGLAKIRTLLPDEIALAKSVFQNTLNYSIVRVTDTLGLGAKPWTTNSPPLYLLNVGGNFPNLAVDDDRRRLLIHELTHVWQAQHLVPITMNSAVHQTLSAINNGGDVSGAYVYTAGKAWGQYNIEQQASIVAHWFMPSNRCVPNGGPCGGGMKTTDARYRYIRDNIRQNKAF
ncbi:MAG: hypothetical protein Q8L74_16605 [Nitrospirota bacterium]|nr:hypothetical protein [Nitrospirota bacterium]